MPERTIVDIQNARPEDPAWIDSQLIAVMDMIVEHRGEEIVCRRYRVKIPREVEIDLLHRNDLRVPASNLVRNVLEEVFEVVESVSGDMGDLFEDVLEEANSARARIRRRADGRSGRSPRSGRRRHESWSEVAETEIDRDEAAEYAQAPGSREGRRDRSAFAEVVGWQPLVMNQAQDCADCGSRIPSGARAFVGVTETGISRTTLCRPCLQER